LVAACLTVVVANNNINIYHPPQRADAATNIWSDSEDDLVSAVGSAVVAGRKGE
jgi:hypothetical protein